MTNTAIRLGGLALVVGAVLGAIALVGLSVSRAGAVGPAAAGTRYAGWVTWLLAAGAILIMLAFPAVYASQARESGALGLVGFALLQVGWVMVVVLATAPLLYEGVPNEPGESVAAFSLGSMLALGFVLTSIATLRAGVFPTWTGYLLLAAAIGFFFMFFVAEFLPAIASRVGGLVFGVLFGVGLASIGLTMWTRR